MADAELIAQGLEALEGLIGLVFEEALDRAVTKPPEGSAERLQWLADLRQAGTDVATLAEAAAAVLRRWPDPEA